MFTYRRSVNCKDYMVLNDRKILNYYWRIRKRPWHILRYYPNICLEVLRKFQKTLF